MSRLSWLVLAATIAGCGGGSSDGGGPGGGGGGQNTADDPADVVAWGDSLTLGAGATSDDTTFPGALALLTGRSVYNKGIGGQTSTEIAARQGGVPARLTLVGNSIPDVGAVTVQQASVQPVSDQGPGEGIAGTIAGVHGTLTFEQDGPRRQWLQFNRDGSGARIPVAPQTPYLVDPFGAGAINVFWMGRNNTTEPDRVLADIQACVATLSTDHYLVLSIANGQGEGLGTPVHSQITSLNARLAQAFPGHYLDIRTVLVESYDPANVRDQLDHVQDIVPSSLRSAELHLNPAGYAIVAERVAAFLEQNGW